MSTKRNMLLNKSHDTNEKKGFYKLVFALVIPMALQNLINVGVSSADVIMLGRVSETSISASSLANQIQFIMTLITFGITSGASVLTAQYWGKQEVRTIENIWYGNEDCFGCCPYFYYRSPYIPLSANEYIH